MSVIVCINNKEYNTLLSRGVLTENVKNMPKDMLDIVENAMLDYTGYKDTGLIGFMKLHDEQCSLDKHFFECVIMLDSQPEDILVDCCIPNDMILSCNFNTYLDIINKFEELNPRDIISKEILMNNFKDSLRRGVEPCRGSNIVAFFPRLKLKFCRKGAKILPSLDGGDIPKFKEIEFRSLGVF